MIPDLRRRREAMHRLCALCNESRNVIALGVLLALTENRLRLQLPDIDIGQATSIQFGTLRLDPQTLEEM